VAFQKDSSSEEWGGMFKNTLNTPRVSPLRNIFVGIYQVRQGVEKPYFYFPFLNLNEHNI
jgi:hypothetical protein